MKCSRAISKWHFGYPGEIFLKRSLLFPILLFSSISLSCSLRKPFLYLLGILWNSAFGCVYLSLSLLPFTSLLFSAIWKASLENNLLSCIYFSFRWFWLPPPVQCYEPLFIVLHTHCLPDLIPWVYLLPLLYNHKWFVLGHTWLACGSHYLLQFKLEFCNKELMIWARVSYRSCLC